MVGDYDTTSDVEVLILQTSGGTSRLPYAQLYNQGEFTDVLLPLSLQGRYRNQKSGELKLFFCKIIAAWLMHILLVCVLIERPEYHAWNVILIDEFQINEINVDLRTSGFDNEVLSVDACAV